MEICIFQLQTFSSPLSFSLSLSLSFFCPCLCLFLFVIYITKRKRQRTEKKCIYTFFFLTAVILSATINDKMTNVKMHFLNFILENIYPPIILHFFSEQVFVPQCNKLSPFHQTEKKREVSMFTFVFNETLSQSSCKKCIIRDKKCKMEGWDEQMICLSIIKAACNELCGQFKQSKKKK